MSTKDPTGGAPHGRHSASFRRAPAQESILSIRNLEIAYGGIRAVKSVSLELPEGELRVILGANGAGKSSIIRSIAGLVRPTNGSINYAHVGPLQQLPVHRIHALGIAWIPEGREVFATLTVQENLAMGAFNVRDRAALRERFAKVYADFPLLDERKTQLAGSLSGGEQQMLALGRALMSEPRLLLMDEPSLGLAPKIVQHVFEIVETIRNGGITVLMAEQNARQALRIADYAYLLVNGEIAGSGTTEEMEAREDVKRAYLGA